MHDRLAAQTLLRREDLHHVTCGARNIVWLRAKAVKPGYLVGQLPPLPPNTEHVQFSNVIYVTANLPLLLYQPAAATASGRAMAFALAGLLSLELI